MFPRMLQISLVLTVFCCLGCDPAEQSTKPNPPAAIQVLDLDGNAVKPLAEITGKAVVFLFTKTDCPISNRYAPTVLRLCETYREQGIEFCLVYADRDETPEMIRTHMKDYAYTCRAVRDLDQNLVAHAEATTTPEAAVYLADGSRVYLGRIDDRFVDFGKTRAEATKHDLAEVLDVVAKGERPASTTTKAIGCPIPPRD